MILPEQLLLLALDDDKGTDRSSYGSDPGLAAGLLLELAREDLVRVDGKHLRAEPGFPSHPLAREALEAIRSDDKPRKAEDWVGRLPKELKPLRDRVAGGLVEQGILDEQRSKVLGVFARTRWPEADPAPERELRGRLREVLVNGREPTEQEALLVGLLEPLRLIDRVVEKGERKAAGKRAKEVAEQGIAGDAVRDAVAAVQAAVMTAAIVPAISAATISST